MGEKSNLKQLNMTQHNTMWKKWRDMKTFYRYCISTRQTLWSEAKTKTPWKPLSVDFPKTADIWTGQINNISQIAEIHWCPESRLSFIMINYAQYSLMLTLAMDFNDQMFTSENEITLQIELKAVRTAQGFHLVWQKCLLESLRMEPIGSF